MSTGYTITNNGKKNLQETMKRDHEEFYSIILNQHVIFEAGITLQKERHNKRACKNSKPAQTQGGTYWPIARDPTRPDPAGSISALWYKSTSDTSDTTDVCQQQSAMNDTVNSGSHWTENQKSLNIRTKMHNTEQYSRATRITIFSVTTTENNTKFILTCLTWCRRAK